MAQNVAAGRLSVFGGHLQQQLVDMNLTAATDFVRPAPAGGAGTITVIDNRTGKKYEIKISEGGTIKASDLSQVKAGGDGVGLRTYDPGYVNTSAVISRISYIDGGKGVLRYRGYPIEQLAEKSNFLETAYLVIYGELPSAKRLQTWEETVMRHRLAVVTINGRKQPF